MSPSDELHSACFQHCRVHRCTLDKDRTGTPYLSQQNFHAWHHDSDFTSIAATGELLHCLVQPALASRHGLPLILGMSFKVVCSSQAVTCFF